MSKNEGINIECKVLDYLKTLNTKGTNDDYMHEFIVESLIPIFNPLTKKQYQEISEVWPCFFLTRELLNSLDYKIDDIEIESNFNYLLKFNKEALLYDPFNKIILSTNSDDSIYNPINHSIMNLIRTFSQTINKNKNLDSLLFIEDIKKDLVGSKREAPYQSVLDHNEQYYCKDLVVFTLNEPCVMCSMALSNFYYK